MKDIEKRLDSITNEINSLENNISELKEKYPEISAYELVTRSNSNEYFDGINEIIKQQLILQEKKLEYENLIKEENSQINNNDFVDIINKIISKHGILNWSDLTVLTYSISVLQKCNFLIEEEKNNIKLKIENRILENNELIGQICIKINEPKIDITDKVIIKNKTTSVIAKGRKTTINSMKNEFKNSVNQTIKNAKDIYQKFCDSKINKIQCYLDNFIENINEKAKEINENDILNQKLLELERKFKMKEEQSTSDKNNINIKTMYRQLIESNNNESEDSKVMSM